MKKFIAIRKGHLKGVDGGATGIIDEYENIRQYAPYTINALLRAGMEVIDVTPSTADTLGQSLGYGVDQANTNRVDLFISEHMNKFNGTARGCTGYINKDNPEAVKLINHILARIAELGFPNRGYMDGYDMNDDMNDADSMYEIKFTDMTAAIIEPLFIDNLDDAALYQQVGPQALGEAIAKGILDYCNEAYVPEEPPQPTVDINTAAGKIEFTQVYGGNLEAFFTDNNTGKQCVGIVKLDSLIVK